MIEWKEVAEPLFLAGWSCIGVWVARSIERMRDSVESLNINMAVVVKQVEHHEKRLERLEENNA